LNQKNNLSNETKILHFSIITLVIFSFSSCERKSGKGNISRESKHKTEQTKTTESQSKPTEKLRFDNCICENYLCDYCVKVISITDGDTFKGLTENNEEIKFRIHGIDAPEKKQAFGTKSKEYLSDLIFGKTVGIKLQSKDRYGRSVVWVYTANGEDVSALMIQAGMAWHYKKYDDSRQYVDLEDEARANKVGLWVDANPIEPWDFRK
jgi:micrococcal nuclease